MSACRDDVNFKLKPVLLFPMTEAWNFPLSSWMASMISHGFTERARVLSILIRRKRKKILLEKSILFLIFFLDSSIFLLVGNELLTSGGVLD